MAFYHDFLYGDTIETPALPTKSRAQPPRACNNRLVIYYNNADRTFYDKPQQEKRRTTIKQSMFGHVTHKIFNKPLQKKTEQHESVIIRSWSRRNHKCCLPLMMENTRGKKV